MSNDSSRPSSIIQPTQPAQIPRAPPLPAPRPLQRARDAAYRFIGYQDRTRPSSAHGEPDRERFIRASIGGNRFATLGEKQNATATHKTGLEINTIAINESGSQALLGGKEIFKSIRVENGICAEEVNLRTKIRSTPRQAAGGPRKTYSIDIADVAWARGECSNCVAAATSSGKIILYNIGHAELQATQLYDHSRQVHKVTFNPHRSNLLLSGSQDGTVRLWDIRDARNQITTLQSKRKYSGQSDGVRDVKWSPTEGVDFALGTDSGTIQRWDLRITRAPKVRIPAHSLACNTIDWHPDGKHIATASSDLTVRVWDFSTSQKQKARWEVKTPYPVLNARWRPACRSSMVADNGARLATQIATAYDRDNPVVHLWDFRRPSLPFREITPYHSAPTDLIWHTQDLLWTVGREGIFQQSDIQHAAKVIDRRNLQAFAVSPLGEINLVVQKRSLHQHLSSKLKDRTNSLPSHKAPIATTLSGSPDALVLSRSLADDTLDRAFLCMLPANHQARGDSLLMMTHSQNIVLKLDEVLLNRKSYRPQQSAARGRMPHLADPLIFDYLAQSCTLSLPWDTLASHGILQAAQSALGSNGRIARAAGLQRLAQSWKILQLAMMNQLHAREKYRSEKKSDSPIITFSPTVWGDIAKKMLLQRKASSQHSPASMKPIVTIAQQLAVPESTSNVPTPLARPARLPDPDDEVALLPSLVSTDAASPIELQPTQPMAVRPALTDRNLRGLRSDDMVDRVRDWDDLLRLDASASVGTFTKPPLKNQHSDDSFGFLGTFTDSRTSSLPGSFDSDPVDLDMRNDPALGPQLVRQDLKQDTTVPIALPRTDRKVTPTQTAARERASPLAQNDLDRAPSEQKSEPDLEAGKPFTIVDMLRELLAYSINRGDAQTAAHLASLVVPLLAPTHPLPNAEARSIITTYTDTFSALGYDIDEVGHLTNTCVAPPMQAGINPLQIESILTSYHEQLLGHQLFIKAAQLRQLAYPAFPTVYEDSVTDHDVHLMCGTCGAAIPTGAGKLLCETCQDRRPPCPICRSKTSPLGPSAIFTACPLCGHCGHFTCLTEWFVRGQGDGCPTDGCPCDCVDGPWRQEKAKMAEKRRAERDREAAKARVKSDDWRIKESKAVEDVRAALAGRLSA